MAIPQGNGPGVFPASGLEYQSKETRVRKQLRVEVPRDTFALVQRFSAKHNLTMQALLELWIEPHVTILKKLEER